MLFFPARRGRGRGAHERRRRGRSRTGRASSHGAPVGRAGRRPPPCPNGAPLEIFGRVARREEAAGASRWGLGSENRPSRRCAENTGQLLPGIFRSVSGPNSYGKPPIGRSQGRGGGWPPLRPPLARGSSSTTYMASHIHLDTCYISTPERRCGGSSTQHRSSRSAANSSPQH